MSAWGDNGHGQLGNETTSPYANNVPMAITEVAGVGAIAAGDFHSMASTTDGRVFAWGANGAGQLGDGTATAHTHPRLATGACGALAISTHLNATRPNTGKLVLDFAVIGCSVLGAVAAIAIMLVVPGRASGRRVDRVDWDAVPVRRVTGGATWKASLTAFGNVFS